MLLNRHAQDWAQKVPLEQRKAVACEVLFLQEYRLHTNLDHFRPSPEINLFAANSLRNKSDHDMVINIPDGCG